ncbi:glycosyltransferase [Rathayibacter iranicus]|uniref:glycosyltransferase n=1 Tax=Rathayibacter iranicus TaxID=59737 RepID=UPI001403D2EC|nr:glycosyltransferase [Rathayibacter iranicus]
MHVTEAFGAGTAGAIKQYVSALPEHEHSLAFSERAEAPIDESALALFTGIERLPVGHFRRIRAIRTLTAGGRFDLVHAHSSYAGTYVRLARTRRSVPIVYTPHCLAFERRDLSRSVRAAIRILENLLAVNTTVFAGCSPYETIVTSNFIGGSSARAVYVPNVSAGDVRLAQPHPGQDKAVRILGIGRIAPQKDPQFFADTVMALRARHSHITATWIGDGEPKLRRQLELAGVHVTGWLTFAQARAAYNSAPSIYLHTALWEGFPLSILEAAKAGVPAVIRELPLYRGIDIPGRVATPHHAAAEVIALLASDQAWQERIWHLRSALADNRSDVQTARLQHAYKIAVNQ